MKFKLAVVSCVLLACMSVVAAEISLEGITCPVSGKPVVDGTQVAHNGGQVYFCCQNCPKAFAANTEKFTAKANAQLTATKQAKEVKCPLTGRPLNPETKLEVAGVEVTFCCNGCKGKVAAAEGDAKINLVFADAPFKKGFEIVAEEE